MIKLKLRSLIKYDLIKYNNEVVNDVIELYFVFEMLRNKKDIKQFSQNEFDNIKRVYLKNIDKYIK
ncbi:hypothetical protein KQI41_12200 [Tissierella pigra]|uniref:hypothetical protein n=1 Tax=Tissierella pigra TaxID=2607614 RepID=UPI001C121A78|nr:hypothetical protein [Tissierella pigra]MBU5427178.1 hypothetical protein [Tissierella pigra]